MSVQLAVIQPNPLQSCRRCGSCCEYISLTQSPAKLRERFDADQPFNHEVGTDSRDIRTIYAMLKGRCRGKLVWYADEPDKRYEKFIYGPCANLEYEEVDGQRLAKCRLHGSPEKPHLCSGYPYYGGLQCALDEPNPGYMQGCGYNLDPAAGMSVEKHNTYLWNLDPEDMEPDAGGQDAPDVDTFRS